VKEERQEIKTTDRQMEKMSDGKKYSEQLNEPNSLAASFENRTV
jgi:hypothetical protein